MSSTKHLPTMENTSLLEAGQHAQPAHIRSTTHGTFTPSPKSTASTKLLKICTAMSLISVYGFYVSASIANTIIPLQQDESTKYGSCIRLPATAPKEYSRLKYDTVFCNSLSSPSSLLSDPQFIFTIAAYCIFLATFASSMYQIYNNQFTASQQLKSFIQRLAPTNLKDAAKNADRTQTFKFLLALGVFAITIAYMVETLILSEHAVRNCTLITDQALQKVVQRDYQCDQGFAESLLMFNRVSSVVYLIGGLFSAHGMYRLPETLSGLKRDIASLVCYDVCLARTVSSASYNRENKDVPQQEL